MSSFKGKLLQRYFTKTNDQTLNEVFNELDDNNPHHKQIIQIVHILQKSSKHRHQKDLEDMEHYFSHTYKFIRNLKDKISLLSYMQIFREMNFECIPQCKTIFEAGDVGDKMYFILHGEVGLLLPLPTEEAQQKTEQLRQNPSLQKYKPSIQPVVSFDNLVENKYHLFRLVTQLNQGDFFGEIALQNNIPRTGTILTKSKLLLAVLAQEPFVKYIQPPQYEINCETIEFLTQISIFKTWKVGALNVMMRNCEEVHFKPFEYIFKKGEVARYIYFIRQGEVKLTIYENVVEKNVDLKRQKSLCKISAVVQLTIQQHFGDWELYLQENEDIINQKTNLRQQVNRINRLSSVLALSHLTLIRMTLLQFLENYRIFGSFDIVKEICQQQSQLRSDLNQKRSSIMRSTEFKINNSIMDNQKLFSEESEYVGSSRKHIVLPLVLQNIQHSRMRINSQAKIDPQIGAYLLNTERDTFTQNKIDQSNQKNISDQTLINQQPYYKTNLYQDRFKGLQPDDILKVFETTQVINLKGQKRKVIQMIKHMGLRVDQNSPQHRIVNNVKKQDNYFNFTKQNSSSTKIKSYKKLSEREHSNDNQQYLSPFKDDQNRMNESIDTSIILKPVRSTDVKDSSFILKPVRIIETDDQSLITKPIKNRLQKSDQFSPIKVIQREAIFSILKLKTQPQQQKLLLQTQSQQTFQSCTQQQPYQFNQSYLSDQRSKLYRSWRKNDVNYQRFQKTQSDLFQ